MYGTSSSGKTNHILYLIKKEKNVIELNSSALYFFILSYKAKLSMF